MKQLILFTLLVYLVSLNSTAQDLSFKNWNIESGLPSNETYRIMQDQDGFLWVCTDHGIARYDGTSFETFSTLNGLAGNTVFRIEQGTKKHLWFSSVSGGLSYWDGKSMHEHPANDQLKELFGSLDIPINMAIDSNDVIYFTLRNRRTLGYYSVGTQDSIIYFTPLSREEVGRAALLILDNHTSLRISRPNVHKLKPWEGKIKERTHPLQILPKMNYIQGGAYQDNKKRFFFSNQNLYRLNSNKTEIINHWSFGMDEQIRFVYIDKEEQLWVVTSKRLLFYGAAPFYKTPKELFNSAYVASIYQDTEGNYWIATLDQGIFLVVDWNVFHFFKKKANFTKLVAHKDKIFALNSNRLFQIEDSYPFNRKVYEIESTRDYFDIVLWKDKIALPNGKTLQIKKDKIQFNDDDEIRLLGKRIYVDKEREEIVIGAANGFAFIDKNSHLECKNNYRINAIEKKSKDEWFFGTTQGLCLYNKAKHKWVDLGIEIPLLSQRILTLNYFQGYLVVGTRGNGLLLIDPENYKIIKHWNRLDELTSGFIRSVSVENDSVIWIGTNQGANRIVALNGEVKESIELNAKNHLPSNGVNYILIQDSVIWFATDKGLAHVPKKILNTIGIESNIPLHIKKVDINGETFPIQKKYSLKYNQQNIRVEFMGLSFNASNALLYRYQMIKNDQKSNQFVYTKSPTIHFNNISPGQYQLIIEVKKQDGSWQDKKIALNFEIKPHFTQTWYFILLLFGLFLGITGIYVRNILIKKNLEKELAEAEQKSLRGQMKPHFLFNAINSVIYFLYQEQKKQAIAFLHKFATLMRSTLENTQHQLIRLDQDMEHLQLYIDMELESLSNGSPYLHDFSIKNPKNLNLYEWQIPPMLIQPLVENAIIHGLSPKEGERKLWVLLEASKNGLIIRVEDNGIGRPAAKEMKKQFLMKKTSHGLKLLEQRIKTLDRLFQIKIKMEVDDIQNDPNCSTRFTLYFPANLKNNLHA